MNKLLFRNFTIYGKVLKYLAPANFASVYVNVEHMSYKYAKGIQFFPQTLNFKSYYLNNPMI